jgi:hypothetical protein
MLSDSPRLAKSLRTVFAIESHDAKFVHLHHHFFRIRGGTKAPTPSKMPPLPCETFTTQVHQERPLASVAQADITVDPLAKIAPGPDPPPPEIGACPAAVAGSNRP